MVIVGLFKVCWCDELEILHCIGNERGTVSIIMRI